MAYIDCIVDNDYEISTEFPYQIRKKSNGRVVKEWDNGNGYVRVRLNGHLYYKHRIVAQQFIPNDDPEHKTQIDHKNKDRSDFHIENLRYVTESENNKNRNSNHGVQYEFLEEEVLPDDLMVVDNYCDHEFEDYYFSESLDSFILYNGVSYRLLHINRKPNGSAFVCAYDTNNQRVSIYYSKFKKIYGLIQA